MSHPALANLPQGWVNHGERIVALLEALRPTRCVEVGTWKGASAIATARVVRRWGGRVTCVDTFAAGPTGPPTMLEEWRANVKKAGVDDVVSVIVGRSVDVAAAWSDGAIDYCYVDADHTFESVAADLAAWWPYVREGGVMSGDDYGSLEYPGVTQAWEEFGRKAGNLHREGLVWIVKGEVGTYEQRLPTVVDGVTTCAACHRVVRAAHVDEKGRCCNCVAPAQKAEAARPAPPSQAAPSRREKA